MIKCKPVGLLLVLFLAPCLVGCWQHIEVGGAVRLGGIISYIADVEVEAALKLTNLEVTKDETDDYVHSHSWECL